MRHLPELVATIGAVLLPQFARAQYTTVPVDAPTAAECTQRAQTLTAGSLARADSQELAAFRILDCPAERGPALSTALSRRRGQTHSASMEGVFHTAALRGEPLPMVLEIAADGAASAAARVLSLGIMTKYLNQYTGASYSSLREATLGDACLLADRTEPIPATGGLPADFRERIRVTASPIEQSETTPLEVRSAANCVMNLWRRGAGLPFQGLATVDVSQISLVYDCGRHYAVRNAQVASPEVQYEVVGDTGRKALNLAPKPEGQPYSERIVWADPRATVRVLFDGVVIATVTGTGRTCD